MINFDNSATSFPKPQDVILAVNKGLTVYGGNSGRSGHKLSLETAEKIYEAREIAGDFFGADTDNVVFTSNCSHALNIAIKGSLKDGDHVIISNLEHNSVVRPVYAMKNISVSIAKIYPSDEDTLREIARLVTAKTKAIIMTAGSNVTGQILPFKLIGEFCKRKNILYIVDAAQVAGVIDIKLSDGINMLCTAGHKSLYGPSGTGLFITDGKYETAPLMQGGSGSASLETSQPDFMPDKLESGTLNTIGILGLSAGIKYIQEFGLQDVFSHENRLCNELISEIADVPNVIIYRKNEVRNYLPIISFNIIGKTSNETSMLLSDMGFALRGGLHCSGFAHKSIGTSPQGTVRFSPSIFSTSEEVLKLASAIKYIANK